MRPPSPHPPLQDPWWNPAVEAQAMDRIHRLGQFRPITCTRFVIAGTIEERILKVGWGSCLGVGRGRPPPLAVVVM